MSSTLASRSSDHGPTSLRTVPIKAKMHTKLDKISPATVLEPEGAFPKYFPGTKVCCTLGPSCYTVEILVEMLNAGMTTARVDLTWGPIEYHQRSLRNLMLACQKTRRLCGIIVDSLGREIFVKRGIELDETGWPKSLKALNFTKGQQVVLTTRDCEATDEVLPVNYNGLPAMVQPGDEIFIGRYLATGAENSSCYVRVLSVGEEDVCCEIESDAEVAGLLTIFHTERSYAGGCITNKQNSMPVLAESDVQTLKTLSKEFEIDWLALSYCRSASDVQQARQILESLGMQGTKILSKIESRQALIEFRHILKYSDGIILSRGNVGLDVAAEKMCLIQKTMLSSCNVVGKPVIITRVVDTMANTPRPTRAEATDVANAVLDGTDGIMLGAETLRGHYPVETIRCVVSIAQQAEKRFDHASHFEFLMDETLDEGADDSVHGPSYMAVSGSMPTHLTMVDVGSMANLKGMDKHNSHGSMTSMGSYMDMAGSNVGMARPQLSKLESICSSAVRAASKINAKLIIVFTNSGRTARLVAKYRPPMPILTCVIPTLTSDALKWKLVGRNIARQCQVVRGLCPVIAAPFPNGEDVLRESLHHAITMELVNLCDHVVCVQKLGDDLSLKVLQVSDVVKDAMEHKSGEFYESMDGQGDGLMHALSRSFSLNVRQAPSDVA